MKIFDKTRAVTIQCSWLRYDDFWYNGSIFICESFYGRFGSQNCGGIQTHKRRNSFFGISFFCEIKFEKITLVDDITYEKKNIPNKFYVKCSF